MPPLVSILIPSYNAESWLADTLESALGQTWQNREIIVVDDGSKDRSVAIARDYVTRGVQLLVQPNRGASAARNTAFRASRGEWIQFLDADDLLAPDKIERQMSLAAKTGPEFVLSARWTRFTRSTADARHAPEPLCRDSDPISWMIVKLGDGAMMHPAAWLSSRALIDRVGLWDETLSLDDDGEFFSRVILSSQGIRHCETAVSYYRSNITGSLSTRRTAAAWTSALSSQKRCAEALIRAENSARTRLACARLFQRLAFQIYPDHPDLVAKCELEASKYGRVTPEVQGGSAFRFVARTLGWKAAKRIQRLVHKPRP